MARYYISDALEVDWTSPTVWDNLLSFKYLKESTAGDRVAMDEFEERRQSGRPAVIWRFDDMVKPAVIVDQCNV